MKLFLLILILFPIYVFAFECKVDRPDGVTFYGNCAKKGKVIIFKSCADFTCRINPSFVKDPKKGESVCKNQTDIIEESISSHKVKEVEEIPYCIKGS